MPPNDLPIDITAVRRRLLAWWDAGRRDLPWRGEPTPYQTWVSEVMLQQTRVETVVPYYERWMRRFPDVAALADAPEDDVLRAWEGLGYYSRARNLHRAARVVRERFDGRLPDDADALRELPGVGEYTAGAVASIAFGRAEPAVDGNVKRVLSRLLDLESPTARELRDAAGALVPPDRPGDFNQALMELGALICTPRSPSCHDCPLADHCLARQRGTVALRPAPRRRAEVPSFDLATLVAIDAAGALLIRRRPAHGLLARLWEFPALDTAGEEPETTARRLALELVGDAARDETLAPMAPVPHVFTHRRETYHPFLLRLATEGAARQPDSREAACEESRTQESAMGGGARTPELVWMSPHERADYAMPRAQRRILNRVLSSDW